jgi:hypothetical protein
MLPIAAVLLYDIVNAAAVEEEGDKGDKGEHLEAAPAVDILGALCGEALALAWLAAFLVCYVPKMCLFRPMSQLGLLVIIGGKDGAGMGAVVVVAVTMVGLEGMLGTDLGIAINSTWDGWGWRCGTEQPMCLHHCIFMLQVSQT